MVEKTGEESYIKSEKKPETPKQANKRIFDWKYHSPYEKQS
jgi:hypothetical protein